MSLYFALFMTNSYFYKSVNYWQLFVLQFGQMSVCEWVELPSMRLFNDSLALGGACT